jgi:hypothetical protein
VGAPLLNSTKPQIEEPLEEKGVSSKREDAPQQTEPWRSPSPAPQLVELEPCRSNRMRQAPIQDDDECFKRTSYHTNITKTIGEAMLVICYRHHTHT